MISSFLTLCAAMFLAGVGNIFFGKAMSRPQPFLKLFRSPHLWLGIITSAGYFFLWLLVLSWADLSWALPTNAVEYVLVALLAIIFLKEKISKGRWFGIFLISVGIIFMMQSW